MNIWPVRVKLAQLLGAALSCDPALPSIPGTLSAGGLYVRPQSGVDYITYEGGTFNRAVVMLSALVVGPNKDTVRSSQWLDERASVASELLRGNNTLDGLTHATWVQAVSEPLLVSTSTGEFLAIELRFSPIRINP